MKNPFSSNSEEVARWMIQNGADVNAVTGCGTTVFKSTCDGQCSCSFLQELADRVTPDHLTMRARPRAGVAPPDESPMCNLFLWKGQETDQKVQMLVLPGVPVLPEDFPTEYKDVLKGYQFSIILTCCGSSSIGPSTS